jgi:putative flippase GtrA
VFKRFLNLYSGYRKEAINYIFFGVLTTAVNWIVFQIFNAGLSLNWSIANVIAWICSVIFAYITNRRYVFRSVSQNVVREFWLFVQFRLISLLMEMLLMFVMIEIISASAFFSKVVAAVIVVASNYFFGKVIIFKERKK